MTFAVDLDEVIPYTLEDDRELDDGDKAKPIFYIRPLTASQVARIDDSILKSRTDNEGDQKRKKKKRGKERVTDIIEMHVGTVVLRILDAGLVKFENMWTKSGKKIDWDEDDKEKMYSCIPSAARQEIANEIRNRSDLSEDEIKNLDSELSS